MEAASPPSVYHSSSWATGNKTAEALTVRPRLRGGLRPGWRPKSGYSEKPDPRGTRPFFLPFAPLEKTVELPSGAAAPPTYPLRPCPRARHRPCV